MFEKLTEHIYVYPCDGYTDRPNIGLVIGGKYVLLYDAGNSAAHVELMKRDLIKQGLPMPDFAALSHWHWDHSFGCSAWNLPVIAGRETNNQLKIVQHWSWTDQSMAERAASGEDIVFCNEMIKREYPDRSKIHVTAADIVFDERMTIDLGGGVIPSSAAFSIMPSSIMDCRSTRLQGRDVITTPKTKKSNRVIQVPDFLCSLNKNNEYAILFIKCHLICFMALAESQA